MLNISDPSRRPARRPGDDPPAGAAIEVLGLEKRFGDVVALDGLSFSVAAGELIAVLGPNGAGKSTTVNVLSTLVRPDRGRAIVAGHDVVRDPHAVRRSIAMAGQYAAVDEMLTATENLELFGRLRGLDRGRARRRAADLLDRFSLTSAADRRVGGFSGGMRRRLDLAASLVAPVSVLFLDEPTTGLDPRSRLELWDVVRDIGRSGTTIVLTTQYLEEAEQLAERIVLIDHGRVTAEGTPSELKRRVGGTTCVVVPADRDDLERAGDVLTGIRRATVDADAGTVTLLDCTPDVLPQVVDALRQGDIDIADLQLRQPSLDEVFLHLTGGRS